ncbi:hypothetical protein Q5Y75_04970 [Ruegeria sp. 2205SS24-7]|uniref:hypothetical protein n=1 Tax=Ruegeria discodermiae TaxID=3064389 RepID=UPI0027416DD8|nr:hypothetical protein [Ruegeria sp. 2205SS24-7]MDP5216560.1 hypothetical protein [Ruegeria sp. 2205SS24-7]
MAKKSKSELAAEAKEVATIIAAARKVRHNFALFHGKDDLIFKAHKSKNKSACRKMAKDEGAGAKGAVGALEVDGKIANLFVEDPDSTPANFGKTFRKYLSARGQKMKVRLLSEDGDVIDDGEEEDEDSADTPPELGDDIEQVLEKIAKHFEAMKTPLLRCLNSAPADYRERVVKAVELYKKAMKAKSPDTALKALAALRKLVAATPSPVIITDRLSSAGDDAEALGKLDGLVKTCAAQVTSDPAFMDRAFPEMRDMRTALKTAMNKKPPPSNIAELKAMKETLDTMFYDHVDKPPRAHGPECHGPGLTIQQQEDRILKKQNPRTGKKFKGKPVHKASNFLDKAAFVESQMALRTQALDHIDDNGIKPPPEGGKPVRLPPMKAKLVDVLGPNWQSAVQGVKRKKQKGQKDTCVDATWGPDSNCKAIYDLLDDGTLRLVTLYPNPIA